MPIFQLHLHAAEKLKYHTTIQHFDDFRLGTVFPDAMHLTMLNADKNVVYAKDEKECVDLIDRLHFADRLSSNVRIPNFIGFNTKYFKMLSFSDFLRGCIFHLMLDYFNNIRWNDMCKTNDDGTCTIVDSSGVALRQFDNVEDLLDYKYQWQMSYVIDKAYNIFKPEEVSVSAQLFADCWFNTPKTDIMKSIEVMAEIDAHNRATCFAECNNQDFFCKVIDDTINTFLGLEASWR